MRQLLVEMRRLELLMADIYTRCAQLFAADAGLFAHCASDEMSHAQLLEKELASRSWGIDDDTADQSLELIEQIQRETRAARALDEALAAGTYVKVEAVLERLLQLEQGAGEAHGRTLVSKQVDSDLQNMLRALADEDEKHVKRIKQRLQTAVQLM